MLVMELGREDCSSTVALPDGRDEALGSRDNEDEQIQGRASGHKHCKDGDVPTKESAILKVFGYDRN